MVNSIQKNSSILARVAHQAMEERGFFIHGNPQIEQEVAAITAKERDALLIPPFRDQRDLLWLSIDNDDSKDLDQVTYAEKTIEGKNKVYVAIADVALMVKKGSAIDLYANHNTTSVYTPTQVFPMLPVKLSTDLTSLNEGVDRRAVVVELEIKEDGEFILSDIYLSLIHNKAKLTYNKVAALLENKVPLNHPNVNNQVLSEQLFLQDTLAQKIKAYRNKSGSLKFAVNDVSPVIVNGSVELKPVIFTRANSLIENIMIATNVCVTRYLTAHNMPTLRRIVRTPKRWDRIVALASWYGTSLPLEPNVKALQQFLDAQRKRDPTRFSDLSIAIIKLIGKGEYWVDFPGQKPIGHFDLALNDYAHTTAPNRRFADLVMQRLLKVLFQTEKVSYSDKELVSIAKQCTSREDEAMKVDRKIKKSAAAILLAPRIGETFAGIVTGASEKGTWVRLLNPLVEGKVIQGAEGLDVGDSVTVKLVNVDVERSFIDFIV